MSMCKSLLIVTGVVVFVAACGGSKGRNPDGVTSRVSWQIAGGDFAGNSVQICGSRTPTADPKYFCNSSLNPTPDPDGGVADCLCFNFDDGAPLVDNLCPSANVPGPGTWDFSYTVFLGPGCAGAVINGAGTNFTCFDSTALATRTNPNQSVAETLVPGLNTNQIICDTENSSKQWVFTSCARTAGAAPGDFRYDCGCALVGAACVCGDAGVVPADLPGCMFETAVIPPATEATCDILCTGAVDAGVAGSPPGM